MSLFQAQQGSVAYLIALRWPEWKTRLDRLEDLICKARNIYKLGCCHPCWLKARKNWASALAILKCRSQLNTISVSKSQLYGAHRCVIRLQWMTLHSIMDHDKAFCQQWTNNEVLEIFKLLKASVNNLGMFSKRALKHFLKVNFEA